MRLLLTGRDVEISPAVRRLVERKLAKLDRQTERAVVSAQVVLALERHRHLTEVTLHARGDHIAHAVGDTGAWETSLVEAVDKVAQQLRKVKGRWEARKRAGSAVRRAVRGDVPAAARPGRPQHTSVRRAPRYPVKPMTVDEAALAIDEAEHPFLVFRNAETDEVNVVYRRKDGRVGLIEPE
jgi:putative sigma-54 modulation protein